MSFPRLSDEPQAVGVRFTPGFIELTLADGRRVATPLAFYPTLQAASPRQRANFEFLGWGTGIGWPEFDYELPVDGVIAGCKERALPPGYYERTLEAMKAEGVRPPPQFLRAMKGRRALESRSRA